MSDEIKVLHIFGQMNRGGAESLIMNVMRNLNDRRISFYFLVTKAEAGHFDNEINELGGKMFFIEGPRENKMFLRDFKKLLKQIRPDVVHSHVYFFSGLILKIAKQKDIPVRIAHSHTTYKNKNIFREVYEYLMRKLILKNGTHFLGCSKKACESLYGEKSMCGVKTEILQNGIDFNKYLYSSEKTLDLISYLGINDKSKLIGHVGNFRTAKNHDRLIEIFEEVSIYDENIHLVLIGSGPEQNRIEEKVKSSAVNSRVHLLGAREDVSEIMPNFDLFLFPSLYEGLGLVLIEAQAAGVRCITSTNVPKEVDMRMGLLRFLPLKKSNSEWSNEIINELYSPEVEMDSETRERALNAQGYNISKTVNDLKKIYFQG